MIPASSASSGVWWCRSAETSSASVMVPKAARDRVEQTVGAVRDGRGDEALESHLSVGAICAGCCLCSSTATAARAGAGGYPCLCGQVPPRTSPTSAASSRRAISGKPGPWRQRNRGHSDSSTENGHLPCAIREGTRYPPTSSLNPGSSRIGARSESSFAYARNCSDISIARRRWSSASVVRPARLSQHARL